MCIVSTKIIKTTLLACLPCLLINFSSCSFFNDYSTGSVSLNVNSVRSALSKIDEAFIDIELNGDYEDKQTISITSEDPVSVTFSKVPIGANVFVSAKAYSLYKDDKVIIYSGTSERKTIEDGDNTFAVKMETVYDSIAQGPYSCLYSKPLFFSSSDNSRLKNNRLEFKNTHSFYWRNDKISGYQKAIVILRTVPGIEGDVTIKFMDTQTGGQSGTDVSSKTVTITEKSSSCELIIPEDVAYNAIYIDHTAAAEDGFICIIESIELQTVGSFELIDITMPTNPTIDVEVKVGSSTATASGILQPVDNKTIKLTAPAGFTTYTWKINDEEKQTGTNNVYSFNTTTLTLGLVYEITLFADSDSQHESWTIQIRKLSS